MSQCLLSPYLRPTTGPLVPPLTHDLLFLPGPPVDICPRTHRVSRPTRTDEVLQINPTCLCEVGTLCWGRTGLVSNDSHDSDIQDFGSQFWLSGPVVVSPDHSRWSVLGSVFVCLQLPIRYSVLSRTAPRSPVQLSSDSSVPGVVVPLVTQSPTRRLSVVGPSVSIGTRFDPSIRS